MRALVLGVNGQDGSYLAEELLRAGYTVVGAGRQPESRYVRPDSSFVYIEADLENAEAVGCLLREARPDAIYHMAAVHGPAGFNYEETAAAALCVNTVLVQLLLEYLRLAQKPVSLTCAGSAKQFGARLPETVDEASPRRADCLYSISKNTANDLLRYYREKHNVRAGMIYYWNHESPRRSPEYFIPVLLEALTCAVRGEKRKTRFRSLDFWCDWGSAEEYMHLTRLVAEKAPEQDVIMASGRTVYGGWLAETLFSMFGRCWRDFLDCQDTPRDVGVLPPWRVNNGALRAIVGTVPLVRIEELCLNILDNKGIRPFRSSTPSTRRE